VLAETGVLDGADRVLTEPTISLPAKWQRYTWLSKTCYSESGCRISLLEVGHAKARTRNPLGKPIYRDSRHARSGIFGMLSFLTRDGRPLPGWLEVFSADLFAWLGQELLYLAILVGLIRLVVMGRTLKTEHANRAQEYKAWIDERGREISNRCISEYKSLKKKIDDFVGTAFKPAEELNRTATGLAGRIGALETAQADMLGTTPSHEEVERVRMKLEPLELEFRRLHERIMALEAPDDDHEFKEQLAQVVERGRHILSSLRDHSSSSEITERLRRRDAGFWDELARQTLGRYRPAFTDVFAETVEPPIAGSDAEALFHHVTVKIERLNALRATLT
jgi:hypothetical protein